MRFSAVLLAGWVSAEPISATQFDFVDSRVQQVMEEWRAPGAIVLVIDQGEVVFSRGYGVADLETDRPIDVDTTLFRFASISKPVTAAAVMRLHQQDRIDLHADIHRYLAPLRFEGSGALTMAHLLTHTGGFEDRFLTRMSRQATEPAELEAFLAEQMPRRAFAAGEVSLYSNHGMALAGLIVERISGQPFPEAVRELVFEPLGMPSSSFKLRQDLPQLAQGHRYGNPVDPIWIKTTPASMLISTGADMSHFMMGLLRPQASDFLERETVDLMLKRHFEHHSTFTGRAYGFSEDSATEPRRLFHSGSLDGFSSGIVLVPERSGGVLVALNGNAYVWGLVNETLELIFEAQPKTSTDAAPEPSREPAVDRASVAVVHAQAGRYVPAEIPSQTFDKARTLFEQIVVDSDSGHALLHRGRRYEALGNGSFADENGHMVVQRESSVGWLLLEEGATWRRLPWHADARLHLVLFAFLLVALLLQLTGRPLLLRRYALERGAVGRWQRLAAALLLCFFLGTGSLIGTTMSRGGGVLRFEIPWYLELLLLLPFAALIATLVAVSLEVARSRGEPASLAPAIPVLAASTTVLLVAVFLHYWRLLGFQF